MEKNIFSEIKSGYDYLTKTEKKIADEIFSNPSRFTNYSISELSDSVKVSQGSINNFAKKFCTSGFSQLKLKIAADMSKYTQQSCAEIDKKSAMKAILKNRIIKTAEGFDCTLNINSEANLKNACKLILGAKRVEIYGIYQSGIVARDLCYQLIQLGVPASYMEDTLMGAVAASMLNSDSLVIALSSSGQTKDILDAVELAKNGGAKVLSITSNNFSTLARESDIVLLTSGSSKTINNKNNEIRLSQLLICDALCSYVKDINEQNNNKRNIKLEKILSLHSINND